LLVRDWWTTECESGQGEVIVPKAFLGILALALAATLAVVMSAAALSGHIYGSITLEITAWFAICCTYLGFAPAELLLGPRRGFQRQLDRPWPIQRLYAAVFAGVFGAILGIAILATLTGPAPLLLAIATGFVLYHFILRHLTTESKGTPHLGQRGPTTQRTAEVLWGQAGDLYLIATLAVIWGLTKHPIWILATAVVSTGYMLGVWIHRRFDPEPRGVSSYLGPLGCLGVMCVGVLTLGFEPQVPNILKQVEWALAIIAAVVVLDRQPYAAAIVAAVGVATATVYGHLVGQDQILTGFKEMLFNPAADWRRVRDYWVFLAVFSFVANTALSRFLELLLGERGKSTKDEQSGTRARA
jgi:hypothetical protein